MIELTDEMREAFADAKAAVKGCDGLDDGDEQGLAAVLAIVERDRCMEARGHVWHPLAKRACQARGFAVGPGCIRRAGHEGGHGYSDGSGEQDTP